jgi:putative SOS response-associated peptidase YedK
MCGKFTQLSTWAEVHAFSQPLTASPDGTPAVISTPMRFANILRLDAEGKRELVAMRWGFPDRSAKNPSRPKHMHARAETVDQLPTFAHAFRNGRGILFVDTFNEGEEMPNGKTKQWTIRPKDRKPIALAVIGEEWLNGEERLPVFIQITVPANALIAPVTDRMPAVLAPAHWPLWLGETPARDEELKACLATFDDGGAWEIYEEKKGPQPSLF